MSKGHFVPRAKENLVVIHTGYDQVINQLLPVNPGLPCRFSNEIVFEDGPSTVCIEVLDKALAKENTMINGFADPSQLNSSFYSTNFRNSPRDARDFIATPKKVVRNVLRN